LQSERKHLIITEAQAAIARALAAHSEVPKTVPMRIADLLRELHRRLRAVSTEPSTPCQGGTAPGPGSKPD
jgi:hypothetical protein